MPLFHDQSRDELRRMYVEAWRKHRERLPLQPLEAAAKTSDKQIRVKTLRHTDHIEVGKDLFDDHVSTILQKIGEPNIISITSGVRPIRLPSRRSC